MRKLLLLFLLFPAILLAEGRLSSFTQSRADRNYGTGLRPTQVSSLTAYWDASLGSSVTSSGQKVSQLNDLSGNDYHLTQATAGNQPYLSRSDNRENRLLYSEDLSQTAWAATNVTKNDATKATFTAQNGTLLQSLVSTAGVTYVASFQAKNISGNTALKFTATNAAAGDQQDITLTSALAQYSFTFTGKTGSGAVLVGLKDANAAGHGQIEFTQIQVRVSQADSTYIATTTYPQYRGINGNTALVFDGVDDYLTNSGVAFSSIFGAQAKTIIAVYKTNLTSAYQNILAADNGTAPILRIHTTGGSIDWTDTDGGAKSIKTATNTNVNLVSVTHDTSNLSMWLNGVAVNPVACGASASLARTLEVGAYGAGLQSFNGSIAAIAVYNRALSSDERIRVEQYFRRKYGTN